MKTIQNFMEQRAYGVCSKLGEKLGISSSSIRLYFIYTSFLAFGSPIILYLVLAFWLNIRKYLRRQKNFVRELWVFLFFQLAYFTNFFLFLKIKNKIFIFF